MAVLTEEERRRRMGAPQIDLDNLQPRAPVQSRAPDQQLVNEVKAGLHPTMLPFQRTEDGSVPNNPNRITVEALQAPDAPEGSRRFVDLGADTEKNRKRLFTGRDDVGYTPAQAARMFGEGLDKDAPFTDRGHLGKFNLTMRSDPLNSSYMVRPDGLRGNFQGGGGGLANPVRPTSNTSQVNTSTTNAPSSMGIATPPDTPDFITQAGLQQSELTNMANIGDGDDHTGFTAMQQLGGLSRALQPFDAREKGKVGTGKRRPSLTGRGSVTLGAAGKGVEIMRDRTDLEARAAALAKDPKANLPVTKAMEKAEQKAGGLLKKGYKGFKDTLLMTNNEFLFKKGYDMRNTPITQAWNKMDDAISTASSKVKDSKIVNNRVTKAMGKLAGGAGKLTEKAARNPYVQLGLASIDGVSEVVDWFGDNEGSAKVVTTQYDPEQGRMVSAPSEVAVNADSYREFNRMVDEMNIAPNLSLEDAQRDATMLPKKATDIFFSGNQRATGDLALEKFLRYPMELSADAGDDPQMAYFVAQSLQLMKDAKAMPTNNAKQAMQNQADAKDMILDMAKNMIKMRTAKKNAEWASWAEAKGKRSAFGKSMAAIGLSDTDWIDPITGETRSGAPANDPVMEWSMMSPSSDIVDRKRVIRNFSSGSIYGTAKF